MTVRSEPRRFWRAFRGLLPPFVLIGLLVGVLLYGLQQLADDAAYERAVLNEWVQETRIYRQTLPELIRDLYALNDPVHRKEKAEAIEAHLGVMGNLPRAYPGQLPLFPVVYRLELDCTPILPQPIVWDSGLPSTPGAAWQPLSIVLYEKEGQRAVLRIAYQLHAYTRWQETAAARRNWLTLLAVVVAVIAALWLFFYLRHEQERAAQRLLAQEELRSLEKRTYEEQLLRQKAETAKEEAERRLLEQELVTQEAERQALEAKTQMYAHIGIMAGSYAHNIKNLMVRPADLLRRCQEVRGLPSEAAGWLREMEQSLTEVAERTQQILRMVRANPTQAERTRCDLAALARSVEHTWAQIGREKWKLLLTVEAPEQPLWIEADVSQVTQAIENLLFNARDATFEMRALLRDEARQVIADAQRKDALLAAAGWKGEVRLRVRAEEKLAVLEVSDNGAGMTAAVLARCTEPHFTTKRDSALHEGYATGMGLGLSFVKAVMEHHGGQLQITSTPRQGAVFTLRFPQVGS
jgi:signal transduction histidine kinase